MEMGVGGKETAKDLDFEKKANRYDDTFPTF